MGENASPTGERLAKVIARAGICSRRDAEGYITAGRVAVNGSVVKTPAFNVIEADTIAVDGKPIARKPATQLWLYHKPAGLMVTERDPEGRPTVFEAFAQLGLPRVMTVGRLDFNTEGLLLLTNDGGLKRTLELPSTGWVRRYRVRAFGSVTQEQLDTLADGITVEGIDYGPIEAELDSTSGSNVWITVALREGKNREVRNVLGALGLEVNRLIRLSYGPFQLGDLPSAHVEKVKTRVLQDQLGKRLAASAGADFDGPMDEEAGQARRRAPQRPESRPTERDRYTGLRKRPDFKRPEPREQAPRTLHFEDGRPSETFVPRGDPRRRDGDTRGGAERPVRDGGYKKRFDDAGRPRRDENRGFEQRKGGFGDRPFHKRPRPDGQGERPGRDRPADDARPFRKDGERPQARRAGQGRDDRPFGERPPRRDGQRPFGKAPADRPWREKSGGETRPFRKDDDRPQARRAGPGGDDRKFGDRPPRRDADRPFTRGDNDRPWREKPAGEARPFRKEGTRPPSKRPASGRDGKPFAKGPRRDNPQGQRDFGRGPRPERGSAERPGTGNRKPAGGRKPFNGKRPDRPARPPRGEDE